MTLSPFKPLVTLALALTAGMTHAAVVTFDRAQHSATVAVGTTYSEDGFTFTSATTSGLLAAGTAFDADTSATSGTLAEGVLGTAMTVTHTGGGIFDLASLDLADYLNLGLANTVTLSYITASGVVSTEALKLDNFVGLQTFALNLDDLTSFTLTGVANKVGRLQLPTSFQLDNVNVTSVPEPGSMALLLAGIGLVGTVAKRRKV